MEMICRALASYNGRIEYSSVTADGQNQIETDKKFGFLKPSKEGILTFSITNRDGEISERAVDRAVKFALGEWAFYVPIKFKKVPKDGRISVEFKSEYEDPILNSSTLAYMYYPISGTNSGKCVINTRFFWTNDGKGINMSKIDPIRYDINTKVKGKTWDLDQVLRHEFGHGVFGLPHDKNENNIMSANYGVMKEHLTEADISRARAKAGVREIPASMLQRLKNWINVASERDYN
ncbi:MAG: matrixin family metalloprotease [Candidatus Nitrosotenuis sp.]